MSDMIIGGGEEITVTSPDKGCRLCEAEIVKLWEEFMIRKF